MAGSIRKGRGNEEVFIDVFNFKLASGQECFVSHPTRSLAQAYVYRNQYQPFGTCGDGYRTVH